MNNMNNPEIQQECDQLLGELSSLWVKMTVNGDRILFKLDYAPGGYDQYLAENYSTTPLPTTGLVFCHSWKEAKMFLLLCRDRDTTTGTIDSEKIAEVVGRIRAEALREAVNNHFADESRSLDDMPVRDGEIQEFNSFPYEIDPSHFIYTLNWSDLYGAHPSKELPLINNCLLVDVVGDTGNEQPTEVLEDEWQDIYGIPADSLEAFIVAKQLNGWDDFKKKGVPSTFWIRYDLMGGIWLKPIPEAGVTFNLLRQNKVGCFAENSNFSDLDNKIRAWLTAAIAAINDETDEDDIELLSNLRQAFNL